MEEIIDNFRERTIAGLIEKSVLKHAENTALIFNAEHLTYKELNARANQVAAFLIAKGLKPETLVPVCLNSGIQLITVIIGVIKAGGAYVPVDPEYPEYRINYIVNDCDAKLIIASSSSRKKLQNLASIEIIEADTDLVDLLAFSEENPHVGIDPKNLAYLMYTSGTTGVPNGVMIEHHSVVTNLNWAKDYFRLSPDDIVLQKTNFCFDVSVWEIFWPLITGAKLVIINNDDYKDIEGLKRAIDAHKVTTIHFVPTMLELFLLNITPGECISLQRVISSGEALTPFQANLVKNKIPGAKLYNLYGPTETTIHSTYWQAPANTVKIEQVPIGKPVEGTEIVILNEQNQIQPYGTTGEIAIAGTGLARGYLNKTHLTLKKFIAYPDSDHKSARLFKTGDLGRYLTDGNLEYLGRIDDQVKVNGYRIELESIEANIKNSGIARQCVVLTKRNALGATQVTAFVVLKPASSIQDLWDYLVNRLPAYMLPTSIKEVETIPFTANGKVDKERLLGASFPKGARVNRIVPVSGLEKKIMAIWTKLFERDDISVVDNFFEIGGNSIMAVKMLTQLRKETDKHISFLLLYQFPTIESLAKLLSKQDLEKTPGTLVPIKPIGSKPPLFVINGGGLVAEGFFTLSYALDIDQPVYGFQSNGCDDQGKVLTDIKEIAAYYLASILELEKDGPYCIAGYSLGSIIAFEIAQQLQALGKTVKLLAMIDGLTRDPELIKTKHSPVTILRLLLLNIYFLRYGLTQAIQYSSGTINAIFKKLRRRDEHAALSAPQEKQQAEKDQPIDVFQQHIEAYRKYTIIPYHGNIVVFRAKRITFYMDDFKYLGWRPYAKKTKSISIPGNHFTIFSEANIGEFANALQNLLDQGY